MKKDKQFNKFPKNLKSELGFFYTIKKKSNPLYTVSYFKNIMQQRKKSFMEGVSEGETRSHLRILRIEKVLHELSKLQ